MIQKIISADDIHSKIHTIRGVQVMLDSDLAEIYGYETKSFNRQVKNNIEKFPADKTCNPFGVQCSKSVTFQGSYS